MNIFQAIFLGILEGITEFLPVSSTGHLLIAQRLLGIQEQDISQFFTVVIQFGAILAAVFFFRARLTQIIKDTYYLKNKGFNLKNASRNELLGIWIIVSIIPTLIIGYIFREQVKEWEKSINIIIVTTIFFGVVFYLIENWYKNDKSIKKDITNFKLIDTVIMGFFQAIAIIPGVSRSGMTVSGGLFRNIKMKDSIEISFIMGIPVLAIATGYEIISSLKGLDINIIFMTAIGFVLSFIVGLYSIKATLGILQKMGFKPFMFYRLALGLLLIVLVLIGWLK